MINGKSKLLALEESGAGRWVLQAAGTLMAALLAASFSSQINYFEGHKTQLLSGSGRAAKTSSWEGLANWATLLCNGNLVLPLRHKLETHSL